MWHVYDVALQSYHMRRPTTLCNTLQDPTYATLAVLSAHLQGFKLPLLSLEQCLANDWEHFIQRGHNAAVHAHNVQAAVLAIHDGTHLHKVSATEVYNTQGPTWCTFHAVSIYAHPVQLNVLTPHHGRRPQCA